MCCAGVAVLDEVETVLSLEAEPTLGVYMTKWHGRLIIAAMGMRKTVTLYAVTPRTYKVRYIELDRYGALFCIVLCVSVKYVFGFCYIMSCSSSGDGFYSI